MNVYETFIGGVKKAPSLILSVFPYIAAVMMLSSLFEKSGLQAAFLEKAAPLFAAAGVPAELSELILVKPLSRQRRHGGVIARARRPRHRQLRRQMRLRDLRRQRNYFLRERGLFFRREA